MSHITRDRFQISHSNCVFLGLTDFSFSCLNTCVESVLVFLSCEILFFLGNCTDNRLWDICVLCDHSATYPDTLVLGMCICIGLLSLCFSTSSDHIGSYECGLAI